jgi:hypothetical protein
LLIDFPEESHEVVLNELEDHKKEVPEGKIRLVLNFDMHSDKYGRYLDGSASPGTWATEAEYRGLACVPHFPAYMDENNPGKGLDYNWTSDKIRPQLICEINAIRHKVYEVWVTIDYDFFYVYLANHKIDKAGVEREIQEIVDFLIKEDLWPTRVIPVISRICLPDDQNTPQNFIDVITECINKYFLLKPVAVATSKIK